MLNPAEHSALLRYLEDYPDDVIGVVHFRFKSITGQIFSSRIYSGLHTADSNNGIEWIFFFSSDGRVSYTNFSAVEVCNPLEQLALEAE